MLFIFIVLLVVLVIFYRKSDNDNTKRLLKIGIIVMSIFIALIVLFVMFCLGFGVFAFLYH